MSYTPTNWVNGQTPINAENLNKIEQQLVADSESLAKHSQDIAKSSEDLGKLEKEFEENLSKTLETVENDLNEVKQEVDANTEKLSELEQMLADKLYYEQKVESVGYTVDNPDHSAKSAKINMIGGMTYKDNTGTEEAPVYELRSAPVTEVESVGVNLVPDNWESGALGMSSNKLVVHASDTRWRVRDIYLDAGTYTVHGQPTAWVYVYDENKEINTSVTKTAGVATPYTFTIEKGYYVGLLGYVDTAGTYQINRGAVALPFKPYVKNILPIPEAVQALDGYGDGINETVYNYIDFEKKQFVKRVVKKVFDGTETWQGGGASGTDTAYYAHKLGAYGTVVNHSALCNKFEHTDSISGSTTNIGYRLFNSNGYSSALISIRPENSATLSTTAMKELVAEWYEAGYPLVIYYELATPEIIDISDLLTDNSIPVESDGALTFKNEHCYAVPNAVVHTIDAFGKFIEFIKTV